ncbi:MAG: hypothetical protein RLZZ112_871 [Verrucomicrobiota bacterium]
MKKIAIICQSAPGSKRRLAEEAVRLAAGLAATGRLHIDLVLKDGGLLMLQPEFSGAASTWESLVSPTSRVLVPGSASLPSGGPKVEKVADPETLAQAADLVLRF